MGSIKGFFFYIKKGPIIISLVCFWIFKQIRAVMLAFGVFSQYFIFYNSFEDCKQRQNHLN